MSYGRTWLMALPVLLILILPAATFCQSEEMQDVIYFIDGRIIRGTIIEQILQESIKIQMTDGFVQVYTMDRIARITKEKLPSIQPAQLLGSKKEPVQACVFSLLLPGGGQFYNGEAVKGVFMLGSVAVGSMILLSEIEGARLWTADEDIVTAGFVIIAGAWLWSMVDAPLSASRINRENGWALAPFPGRNTTASVAGLSADGKTAPGVVFTWKF